MTKEPTIEEVIAVKEWAVHNNLTTLRAQIHKSRIGAYMTIARVYRYESASRQGE